MTECLSCAQLRKRVADLEDELIILKDAIGNSIEIAPQWRLTAQQELLMRLLMKRVSASSETVGAVAAWKCRSGGPFVQHYAAVLVYYLRKKLDPHGIKIVTQHSVGWLFDRDTKARVIALNTAWLAELRKDAA